MVLDVHQDFDIHCAFIKRLAHTFSLRRVSSPWLSPDPVVSTIPA